MVLGGLPYACSPIYRFPEPTPFSGSQFYNPYADRRGAWRRANLHAHGRAWAGLTNGQQANDDVVRTYRALGYDIAGISNYHAIAAHQGTDTLPLYEHGYNIQKRHQLAIGAHRVDWVDIPLWQSLSQEQFVIDRVGQTAELVGLTHPDTRGAYSREALESLTGYQYMEVVNGPFESIDAWDAALSAGRAVWAMANDDTHDTNDPRRTGVAWNMIDAESTAAGHVIAALRAGRAYAVERRPDMPALMDVRLASVTMTGETLSVETEGALSDVEFIGQQGVSRAKTPGVRRADYVFDARDTYIRAVIHTPNTTIFLNPILRDDGDGRPQALTATVNHTATWSLRLAVLAVLAGSLAWLRSVGLRDLETPDKTALPRSSSGERVRRATQETE